MFRANFALDQFPNRYLGVLELNYTRLRRVVLYNLLCLLSLTCISRVLTDIISILPSLSTAMYYKLDAVHAAAHALQVNKEQSGSFTASNTTRTKNIKRFYFQ